MARCWLGKSGLVQAMYGLARWGRDMEAFYQDGQVSIYHADVLDWALDYKKQIDAGKALPFMAVISDPPYGLGNPPPIEELLQHWLNDKDYETGAGFMSKNWDQVVHPKYWRALYNITLPGGYLFCFSGTRTADLLGVACRLGGWEPFDRIVSFAWVQAQGMAKGVNISKALDASEVVPCPNCDGDGCETCGGSGEVVGVEREVVGVKPTGPLGGKKDGSPAGVGTFRDDNWQSASVNYETAPATPLAQAFDGYNTSLAPKHEPILLFRRPRDGRTFAQCAREFGSGGLWVDGCRVGLNNEKQPTGSGNRQSWRDMENRSDVPKPPGGGNITSSSGRWPPNVHFTHVAPDLCPACNGAGCDECHGEGVVGGCRRVGSKIVKTHWSQPIRGDKSGSDLFQLGNAQQGKAIGYADQDGKETVADFACVENCPVRALDEMTGERPSTYRAQSNAEWDTSQGIYKGNIGRIQGKKPYTDSGSASRFFVCHDWSLEIAERLAGETPFKYASKASRGERDAGLDDRNTHCAVKPLSLVKWLATLAMPPAQFKPRIAIPFSGSGSEVIGAILAGGWSEIHAIERELEYCEIAAARIAWWSKWYKWTGKDNPDEIRRLGEKAEAKEDWQDGRRQTSLFELLE